jgi:hypothetical protein
VSAYNFTAQDPAGYSYPADTLPLKTTLSMDVGAGRQVRGEVAFDMPKGEVLIDWNPGFSGPAVTWQVTG